MKKAKGKSILLKSPYRPSPVNSTARRVMGTEAPEAVKRLREQIVRTKQAVDSASTPEEREAAQAKLANLERQLSAGRSDPETGPKAVKAARRALERAKWARSNGRG
jgi:hypothetical protein